jgi:hypothetical protein
MEVEPPEGFIAAPPVVTAPDNATTTVRLFCAEMMEMG